MKTFIILVVIISALIGNLIFQTIEIIGHGICQLGCEVIINIPCLVAKTFFTIGTVFGLTTALSFFSCDSIINSFQAACASAFLNLNTLTPLE